MRYRFEGCEFDTDLFELRRAGEPVKIEPQVFDVLVHLVHHRDRVVPKEELLDEVWGDRFVSESALTSRIKAARQALGDDGQLQRCIRTVHGRGYRFVAPTEETTEDREGTAAASVLPVVTSPTRRSPSPLTPPRRFPTPARHLLPRDHVRQASHRHVGSPRCAPRSRDTYGRRGGTDGS